MAKNVLSESECVPYTKLNAPAGSGKSYLGLRFAKYLQEEYGFKILLTGVSLTALDVLKTGAKGMEWKPMAETIAKETGVYSFWEGRTPVRRRNKTTKFQDKVFVLCDEGTMCNTEDLRTLVDRDIYHTLFLYDVNQLSGYKTDDTHRIFLENSRNQINLYTNMRAENLQLAYELREIADNHFIQPYRILNLNLDTLFKFAEKYKDLQFISPFRYICHLINTRLVNIDDENRMVRATMTNQKTEKFINGGLYTFKQFKEFCNGKVQNLSWDEDYRTEDGGYCESKAMTTYMAEGREMPNVIYITPALPVNLEEWRNLYTGTSRAQQSFMVVLCPELNEIKPEKFSVDKIYSLDFKYHETLSIRPEIIKKKYKEEKMEDPMEFNNEDGSTTNLWFGRRGCLSGKRNEKRMPPNKDRIAPTALLKAKQFKCDIQESEFPGIPLINMSIADCRKIEWLNSKRFYEFLFWKNDEEKTITKCDVVDRVNTLQEILGFLQIEGLRIYRNKIEYDNITITHSGKNTDVKKEKDEAINARKLYDKYVRRDMKDQPKFYYAGYPVNDGVFEKLEKVPYLHGGGYEKKNAFENYLQLDMSFQYGTVVKRLMDKGILLPTQCLGWATQEEVDNCKKEEEYLYWKYTEIHGFCSKYRIKDEYKPKGKWLKFNSLGYIEYMVKDMILERNKDSSIKASQNRVFGKLHFKPFTNGYVFKNKDIHSITFQNKNDWGFEIAYKVFKWESEINKIKLVDYLNENEIEFYDLCVDGCWIKEADKDKFVMPDGYRFKD